ncbi:hypothetical protein [Agarivorans albus]|uniref:hypothetical protein n=1 Tax=Agarivorans albus TaxID=182262 RepID=UPI000591651C|nr:hypothetical protein [Agarivorans albus]
MSDEKLSKSEAIAKSVERISDSQGLKAIGDGLGSGLVALSFALGIAAFVFGMAFLGNRDGNLHPQTKCFELQEIQGKIFNVNMCTGEIAEFKQPGNE